MGKYTTRKRFAENNYRLYRFLFLTGESTSGQKMESEDLPKVRIYITEKCFHHFLISNLRGQSSTIVGFYCRYSLCMFQILKIVGYEIIGNTTIARPITFVILIYSHRSTHRQNTIAIVFWIDGGEFNIKDNEQCHHQSNGKSRGCDINRCKKPVLFH